MNFFWPTKSLPGNLSHSHVQCSAVKQLIRIWKEGCSEECTTLTFILQFNKSLLIIKKEMLPVATVMRISLQGQKEFSFKPLRTTGARCTKITSTQRALKQPGPVWSSFDDQVLWSRGAELLYKLLQRCVKPQWWGFFFNYKRTSSLRLKAGIPFRLNYAFTKLINIHPSLVALKKPFHWCQNGKQWETDLRHKISIAVKFH